MRAIISIIIIALTVCVASAKDCGYSLYNLLLANGHNITGVNSFRACADSVASANGLVYDMSAEGNIAIIAAICNGVSTCTTVSGASASVSTSNVVANSNVDVLTNNNSPVLANQGTVCGVSKTVVVGEDGVAMQVPFAINDTAMFADDFSDYTVYYYRVNGVELSNTDTIWHVSNDTLYSVSTATSHIYNDSEDTVGIVSSECPCNKPLSMLWQDYMTNIPRKIKNTKDKAERALLIGCRIKVGHIWW
jgi:hypothetical protein